MSKQSYLTYLNQLLVDQYNELKDNPSKSLIKNQRISGFMEAGLVSGLVNRKEIKRVVNSSHQSVFGVSFDERTETKNNHVEDLWDIPTWIRKGVEVES